MAGPQGPHSTDKIVWQRYNPFRKLGDMIDPELVFIDHGCGAKEPFCEEDPISSKLQHLFFPGPGFIEDTPDVVTRLIAKWHNRQYAKQIEKEMRKYSDEYEEAKTKGDADKANDVADRWAEKEEEYNEVSTGGEGEKTIQPGQIDPDATLKSLLKDLNLPAGADVVAIGELRRDLESRFPVRVPGQEASATDAAYGRAETTRLATALDQAVSVSDAIAYAKGVVGLQIKDRKFVPLVQTASDSVGTIPVSRMAEQRREGLSPFRSLYYQPSQNQPFALAAHIEGTPQGGSGPHERGAGCRHRDAQRRVLRLAGAGRDARPGHQFRFRQRDLCAQRLGLPGRRRSLPGASQAGPGTARWNAWTGRPPTPSRKSIGHARRRARSTTTPSRRRPRKFRRPLRSCRSRSPGTNLIRRPFSTCWAGSRKTRSQAGRGKERKSPEVQ